MPPTGRTPTWSSGPAAKAGCRGFVLWPSAYEGFAFVDHYWPAFRHVAAAPSATTPAASAVSGPSRSRPSCALDGHDTAKSAAAQQKQEQEQEQGLAGRAGGTSVPAVLAGGTCEPRGLPASVGYQGVRQWVNGR